MGFSSICQLHHVVGSISWLLMDAKFQAVVVKTCLKKVIYLKKAGVVWNQIPTIPLFSEMTGCIEQCCFNSVPYWPF